MDETADEHQLRTGLGLLLMATAFAVLVIAIMNDSGSVNDYRSGPRTQAVAKSRAPEPSRPAITPAEPVTGVKP